MGGNFVWLAMIVFSLFGLWMTFTVRDGSAERLEAQNNEDVRR